MWWFRICWGGQYNIPFLWFGPLLITWYKPYWGYQKDVESGRRSKWYWPHGVEFAFYPRPD